MTTNMVFNEHDLEKAAQLVAESMLDSLPPKAACDHTFSDGFLAKMEKLINRQRQRQTWHKMIRFAAAIIITVSLIFGAVMVASPTAEILKRPNVSLGLWCFESRYAVSTSPKQNIHLSS